MLLGVSTRQLCLVCFAEKADNAKKECLFLLLNIIVVAMVIIIIIIIIVVAVVVVIIIIVIVIQRKPYLNMFLFTQLDKS